MKKFLAISLIVCMVFGLVACAKPKTTDTENTQQTETTPLQKINYILEKEGQPTAGYEWTATSDDESIVVVTITNNLADLAKDEHEGYHPTAISSTKAERPSLPQSIYSPDGIRLGGLQPGLNIIRYSDGSSKKIWKKANIR